jgi:glycosyltransferase involved in cell wall biosynthesis
VVRVLHVVGRLSSRGGAYWHLLAILHAQCQEHTLHVVAGERDADVECPAPVTLLPGVESRTRRTVDLDSAVQSFAPDVIHLHAIVNPAVLEWGAERDAILTVQDHRYFCPGRGKWTRAGGACRETMSRELCRDCVGAGDYFEDVMRLTEERLAALKRTARVVVLSRFMQAELAAAGVAANRVAVIPPFVCDLDPAAAPDGAPCVLFVGRLAGAKGVGDAIEAWRRSAVDLPLIFAGTGPERTAIEAQGFEVLGWLDRRRLSRAYRRARAVLMPSLWQEPFGIVGLEALFMGVSVAAYDSGGIPEWHPGPGAGLVPRGDVAALGEALRALVTRGASPPGGFAREALMGRLHALYRARE